MILAGLLLGAVPAAQTVQADSLLTIGTRHTITSQALGEPRPYWVHAPAAGPGERLPVIVLMDGDEHFLRVIGLVDFLAARGRMPRAVIVGVPNTVRLRDLSPATRDTMIRRAGGADRMMDFLSGELLPEIDRRFSTTRFRVLVGNSLGGLFAFHAWLMRPGTFRAYVAISPLLWWDRQRLIDTLAARLASGAPPPGWLYATMADREDSLSLAAFARAGRVAGAGADVRFAVLAGEDHGSAPLRSLLDGLEAVFQQWRMPHDSLLALGVTGLDRRYRDSGARFDMPAVPPEDALNTMGYLLLADSLRRGEAVAVFRENIRRFPRSANTYNSTGDALRRAGERQSALACYAAAVRIAREHPSVGDVVRGDRTLAASQRSLNELARELGRSPWSPDAIPESVVADCIGR